MLSLACSLHHPDKLPREQQNNEYIPNASRKWWICWTVKHNEITIKYTVTLDLEHWCSPRSKHQYAIRCVTVSNAFDALKINSKWNWIRLKKPWHFALTIVIWQMDMTLGTTHIGFRSMNQNYSEFAGRFINRHQMLMHLFSSFSCFFFRSSAKSPTNFAKIKMKFDNFNTLFSFCFSQCLYSLHGIKMLIELEWTNL